MMNSRLTKVLGTLVFAVGMTPAVSMGGEILRFAKSEIRLQETQSMNLSQEADQQIWIVQFKSAITAKDQKQLQSIGAKTYRYIPDDALVVRGSRAVIEKSFSHRLNGLMPFRGDFKLAENMPTLSVFSQGQHEVLALTVIANDEVAAVISALQKLDPSARVIQQAGRFLDVRMNLAKAQALASVAGVEFIEPRLNVELMHMTLEDSQEPTPQGGDYKDLTGYETGTKVMNMDAAYQAGFTGMGQIVSYADTGLDKGAIQSVSPDFQGAIMKGYTVGVGAKSWEDPMGHGTHVAGSIAGRGTASGGALHGAAYNAQLIPEGMWSPIIENLTVPPKLVTLFQPAYDDGARVHSNSWGAARNFGAYETMAQQADEFMWNNPKMLVLFAAGNSGIDRDRNGVIDPGSIGTPGTAKNVLTVGASKNYLLTGGIQKQIKELRAGQTDWSAEPIYSSYLSENANGMACFSSRGPTRDGRLKPEIVAPGTNILSTYSHVPGADLLWGAYNADYVYSGGTSMATPLTAGAAAVSREILVKKWNMADPSGALLKAFLMHTAFDMYPGQFGEGSPTQELQHRPNSDEGYGRVDMAKAVALGNAQTQVVDELTGVGTNETKTIQLTVNAGQSLLANLAYFDAPGNPSAAKALVNDLDLTLTGPNGEQGSHDRINNHEVIELKNLPAGTYTLSVKGFNVPMGKGGKQPYALIYTLQ